MWQGRALREAKGTFLGLVLCSAFDHAFGTEALLVLLQVVFPGFVETKAPQLCSLGKISKHSAVVADMAMEYGRTPLGARYIKKKVEDATIFENTKEMEGEFRRLADKLKLNDHDRRELFSVAQHWVTSDTRLDPRMDPRDPDAKRYAIH
jgi:hypothetical protein